MGDRANGRIAVCMCERMSEWKKGAVGERVNGRILVWEGERMVSWVG